MIQLLLRDIINSSDGLTVLGQRHLKAKTAYTVGKILKAVETEMSGFEQARMDLIKKYGLKDENGELIEDENHNLHIAPENLQVFNTELTELMNTSVEIMANKIPIDDLGDIEFTPVEMAQLESFIEFDE